jgi:hypothetical protein
MLCSDYGKERGQNLPLREVNLATGGKACVPDGLTLAPAKNAKEVCAAPSLHLSLPRPLYPSAIPSALAAARE